MQVSLSILEYEGNLRDSIDTIKGLVDTGLVRELHVDIMGDPFVPGRDAFSLDNLRLLCREFNSVIGLDFHLMVRNPIGLIDEIDKLMCEKYLSNITVHREVYRYNLDRFNSKEYDLSKGSKGLRKVNEDLGRVVCWTLSRIRKLGYSEGVALEPGTDLDNISPEIYDLANRVLLMGVSSGSGGQVYQDRVNVKIIGAKRGEYRIVQVDGGINDKLCPWC